jgi:hypothetical protein
LSHGATSVCAASSPRATSGDIGEKTAVLRTNLICALDFSNGLVWSNDIRTKIPSSAATFPISSRSKVLLSARHASHLFPFCRLPLDNFQSSSLFFVIMKSQAIPKTKQTRKNG